MVMAEQDEGENGKAETDAEVDDALALLLFFPTPPTFAKLGRPIKTERGFASGFFLLAVEAVEEEDIRGLSCRLWDRVLAAVTKARDETVLLLEFDGTWNVCGKSWIISSRSPSS